MPWPDGYVPKDQIVSVRMTADDLAKLKRKVKLEPGGPSVRQWVQEMVKQYLADGCYIPTDSDLKRLEDKVKECKGVATVRELLRRLVSEELA